MHRKKLNKEQIKAVDIEGNVLLTACPGSGKTRALTYRVVKRINDTEGTKQKVMALTFTNRAADEIKKRVDELNLDTERLWAGTIHSFCLQWILKPYMCYVDELKGGFSVSDEYNSEKLISELKKSYGLNFWDDVCTRYTKEGQLEEQFRVDLVNEYHELLKGERLIDFDQILHYSYQLLIKYPNIGRILNGMFGEICIDEYQDTGELQYAIIGNIVKSNPEKCSVFIVGDADQAIYGSLGGTAKSLDEINELFGAEFQHESLPGNYRSSQRIINFYRNFQLTAIEIESRIKNPEEKGVIRYNIEVHRDNLTEHIASVIQEQLNAGIAENDICVLAPTWYLIIPMGRRLKILLPDVNFDAVGLSPLLKNQENIWYKLARLFLVEPSPENYFLRRRWAQELLLNLEEIGIVLFENIEYRYKKVLRFTNQISSDQIEGLEYLKDCFDQFCNRLEIDRVTNEFLSQHWGSFFEGAEQRLKNPEFDMAKDIESFRRMFKPKKGVVVSSCHGIKGEEFETVIAFGLLHGKLPNWRNNTNEEANKLLYVICSRAKKKLYLISEQGHQTTSGNPYTPTAQLRAVDYNYD